MCEIDTLCDSVCRSVLTSVVYVIDMVEGWCK